MDSRIPGYTGETVVLDSDIFRKGEPINLSKDKDDIMAFAIDLGFQLLDKEKFSLSIYSQMAQMIGKTSDPLSGEKLELGMGIVPIAISSVFGPAKFNLEYRIIPKGRFEFNYWNRLYEIERVALTKSSDNQIVLKTKESSLGRFGEQKGYFSRLSINMGSFIEAGASYHDMMGDIWSTKDKSFITNKNQTFITSVRLKKSISRIQYANAFYQQRNVPNPFKFNYTESTVLGYRLGISMGNGLVLSYTFRRSFRDLNGDGEINGANETIDIRSIETSFSF